MQPGTTVAPSTALPTAHPQGNTVVPSLGTGIFPTPPETTLDTSQGMEALSTPRGPTEVLFPGLEIPTSSEVIF